MHFIPNGYESMSVPRHISRFDTLSAVRPMCTYRHQSDCLHFRTSNLGTFCASDLRRVEIGRVVFREDFTFRHPEGLWRCENGEGEMSLVNLWRCRRLDIAVMVSA